MPKRNIFQVAFWMALVVCMPFRVSAQTDCVYDEKSLKGLIKNGREDEITCVNMPKEKLRTVPENVLKCSNLSFLALPENKISDVSPLRKLLKLEVLYLPSNNISAFPYELIANLKLRKIDLAGNELSRLNWAIEKNTILEELYLAKNKLTSLPDGFSKFRKLKVLDVSGNPIVSLPRDLFTMRSFSQINLSGVQVSFKSMEELRFNNPSAWITHYDSLLGCDTQIPPLRESELNSVLELKEAVEQGSAQKAFLLGQQYKSLKHHGFALRLFYKFYNDPDYRRKAPGMQSGYSIAEIYADETNELPTLSKYKNTKFKNIDTFEDDFKNNRGVGLYKELALTQLESDDLQAKEIKKRSGLKYGGLIERMTAELKKLYEANLVEVKSLNKMLADNKVQEKKLNADLTKLKANAAANKTQINNVTLQLLAITTAAFALPEKIDRINSDNSKIKYWLEKLESEKNNVLRISSN